VNEDDTTFWDSARSGMRGKVRSPHDRRSGDRLTIKDWLGYILVVVVPIASALWATHQSVTRMEVRMDRVEVDIAEAKDSRRAIWRKLGGNDGTER
jgi:hypothetical protein